MIRLPGEDILYVGDTAHFPYGILSEQGVIHNVRVILDLFARRGVKAAVMACNTASAVALPVLGEHYPFPLIGVIDAGAGMAVRQTVNGYIGVLATERTVASGAYDEAVRRLNPTCRVLGSAAPHLVTMVEEGYLESDPAGLDRGIMEHLQPLVEAGVDTIILGCTHFLALRERIMYLFPGQVTVIDPAAETAAQLSELLGDGTACARVGDQARYRFLISGEDFSHFKQVGSRVLGRQIQVVERFPGAVARVN